MTVVAAIEAFAIIAVVYLLLRSQRDTHAQMLAERRELLNRIQRPEHIPLDTTDFEVPDQQPDEWNLVGTIQHDDGMTDGD